MTEQENVIDFIQPLKMRQFKIGLNNRLNQALNRCINILTSSDDQLDAIMKELPPEYQEYVETGNLDALRRHLQKKYPDYLDDNDFESISTMTMDIVKIAEKVTEPCF